MSKKVTLDLTMMSKTIKSITGDMEDGMSLITKYKYSNPYMNTMDEFSDSLCKKNSVNQSEIFEVYDCKKFTAGVQWVMFTIDTMLDAHMLEDYDYAAFDSMVANTDNKILVNFELKSLTDLNQ